MQERVHARLRDQYLLKPNKAVIAGVSGGPDSLCLLDILHKSGYKLIVAHLDHGLRSQSTSDARAVRREAEKRSLSFILGESDVASFAADNALSLEEAARIKRYQFLFSHAERLNAQAVAVGHTADDQIETVLMHLLRGSGLSGLKGMSMWALPNPWSEVIPLVRPLLAVWRKDVLAYCKEQNLTPVIDASNLDTTIYRNRLRHELIPTLETYNPAIKEVLYRTTQVLSGDFDVLEGIVDQAWASALLDEGQDYAVLDLAFLRKQPVGMCRNLLRRAIALLRPDLRDIDYDSIERGLDFLAQPSQTNQIDLVAGLRLMAEEDRLWLTTWTADLPSSWPQMTTQGSLKLELPGEVLLKTGWRLRASEVAEIGNLLPAVLANEDPYQAWVDKSKLDCPIVVRTRQPGDRFIPLGLGGHSTKLSEFMINVKMPRRAREAWPLVCAGDDIVWIPGYRLGHPFRITPETREAVYLHLIDTRFE